MGYEILCRFFDGSKLVTGNMSGGMNLSGEMLLFLPPRSVTLIMTNPLVRIALAAIFPCLQQCH